MFKNKTKEIERDLSYKADSKCMPVVGHNVKRTGVDFMRIGINEVIIHKRSTGTRQRELNSLPELLRQIKATHAEAVVYIACDLETKMIENLIGDSDYAIVTRTPIPAVPTYQRLLGGVPYWRRQVIRDRLDLFHTSYFPPPRLPIPIVLTINDLRFIHLPNTYRISRLFFLRLIVPLSIKRASRIIAISGDTKADLVHHFGVEESKIDVIHIPVNPSFRLVEDPVNLAYVRQKYSLPDRFILCVGHLEPRKNLQKLIQAFFQLKEESQLDHSLVILGKPSFGLEAILSELVDSSFSDQIIFTGYVPDGDLPTIYSLADLMAFPSLHEGFGLPVLEAMACGTPVVTSNVAALPEIAGDAAVLVNPYSIEAIASGIFKVLNDSKLRAHLITMGLERVKAFTAEKTASKILNTYRKVLNIK